MSVVNDVQQIQEFQVRPSVQTLLENPGYPGLPCLLSDPRYLAHQQVLAVRGILFNEHKHIQHTMHLKQIEGDKTDKKTYVI